MKKNNILEKLIEINDYIREASNNIDEANRQQEKIIKEIKKDGE